MLSYKHLRAIRESPTAKDVELLSEELYEAHMIIDAQCEYIMYLNGKYLPKVYNSTESAVDPWVSPKKRHIIGEEWK